MLEYLQKAKQYLWIFVEIGFLAVLSIVLIHLSIGPNSGDTPEMSTAIVFVP